MDGGLRGEVDAVDVDEDVLDDILRENAAADAEEHFFHLSHSASCCAHLESLTENEP